MKKAGSKIDWPGIRKSLEKYMAMRDEFAARYQAGAKERAIMRKAAHPAVKRWDWYTAPALKLDPMYFVLSDDRPGRLLKKEPDSKTETVRYGFDESGRVIVEDAWAISEEFRSYSPERIETMTFHRIGPCIGIEVLFLKRGIPEAYVLYWKGGMVVSQYQHEGGRIVAIHTARRRHVGVSLSTGGTAKTEWYFETYRLTYDKSGSAQVVRQLENGMVIESRYKAPEVSKKASAPPVLDLRKDVKAIEAQLGKAVRVFAGKQKRGAARSRPGPVSGITLIFRCTNDGMEPAVWINFDTRRVYEPDGSWTHGEFAVFPRPGWADFWTAGDDSGKDGVIIDAKGARHLAHENVPEDTFKSWFGNALIQVLKTARTKGVFKPLAKADRCELGVEDSDMHFGWPEFKHRGKENLV